LKEGGERERESKRVKFRKFIFGFLKYVEEFVALLILNSHYKTGYATYYICYMVRLA